MEKQHLTQYCNRQSKPKLIAEVIVSKMRDEKGIKFSIVDENEAVDYLRYVNNYMRTASYRFNYQKYEKGANAGKYIDLEFAYLKELSTIDMYFRQVVAKMTLDIEHALKVKLIADIEISTSTDGYDIVESFLLKNSDVLNRIVQNSSSPFTLGLIEKYFTIGKIADGESGKDKNVILQYNDCPAWVLTEVLTFGDFVKFYDFCYSNINCTLPVSRSLLNPIRVLRNATAHNNCMLFNLSAGSSRAPREVKNAVEKISAISKSQRQKKLSSRPMMEFATLLYVYKNVVSDKVRQRGFEELEKLFTERMLKNKHFFEKNDLIKTNYTFALTLVQHFSGKG